MCNHKLHIVVSATLLRLSRRRRSARTLSGGEEGASASVGDGRGAGRLDADVRPMTAARVRLLGPIDFVTARGERIELPSVAQRRVVAVLALAAGATQRAD